MHYRPVFRGWGPALHARRLTLLYTRIIEAPLDAGAFKAKEAKYVQLCRWQRQLSDRAAELGIAAPRTMDRLYGVANVDGSALAAAFGRIRADRTLLDAIIVLYGRIEATARLHGDLAALCACAGRLDEPSVQKDHHGTIDHHDGEAVWWRWIPVGDSGARYDGDSFCLAERLPDTVLKAAVNGPLGRVVATGMPSLDAALVIGAESHPLAGTGCSFTLRSDLVRIADHRICSDAPPSLPESIP